MITVKTALTFDRALNPKPDDMDAVMENEQSVLDYLDATVESGIYKDFDGNAFDMKIPVKFASPRVIHALKKRYEAGGWTVGIFGVLDPDGELAAHQLVFSPGRAGEGAPPVIARVDGIGSLVSAVKDAGRRTSRSKPRVCLVADVPGWAFDQNLRDLAEYLKDSFDFGFFYTENWFKGERPSWDDYDVIYECYHRNPPMGIPMSRAVGALRSQYFKPEKQGPPDAEDIATVLRYRGFQVAAKRNFDELAPTCPNVVYLTNPVNVRRFEPTPVRDEIVASWNGNAGHKSPDGRFIKHFYDIVVPACSRAKVQLVAAEYNTKDGPMRRRNSQEMSEFYLQSNVALCASDYEAASNSVMEAMTAGLALLVTDVGNHRELRDAQMEKYGDTGIYLVQNSVDAFASALRELTPDRAYTMGQINRRQIVDTWSWDVWADRYADFLKMAL